MSFEKSTLLNCKLNDRRLRHMETLLLFVAENRLTSQDYFWPLTYLHPSNGRLLQSKRSRENWYLVPTPFNRAVLTR
jgi:hypothetical protein